MTDTNLSTKKKIFTKKRVIWAIVLLLGAGIVYGIAKPKDNSANVQTEIVKRQDVQVTVLATGQVVSGTDLSLSFKTSGFVQKLNVKEGDKVTEGQILATLDQKDQLAALTQARGTLAQANANYQKVLAGASNEEVVVAQKAVDAAQVTLDSARRSYDSTVAQQKVLVANAYSALLNTGLAAIAKNSNQSSVTATISGIYNGTIQGDYRITVSPSNAGATFSATGLETGDGVVSTTAVPLGKRGLFIQFSGTGVTSVDEWVVSIPNTQAANYVTNLNAYQSALQTQNAAIESATAAINAAQVALEQAKASLELKKAQARPAEIQAAQAQILSAQGSVQAAQASLENTIVRAPSAGTITTVDIKLGELVTAQKIVFVLQDVNNLHVEADVSEANIAQLKIDQKVDITFDALGPNRSFEGKLQSINPSATVISGVVNYKVVVSIDQIEEIKPGMTANMTVLIAEKADVLAIPERAVISNGGGKQTVQVINDTKKKTYAPVDVETGLRADGGLIEITSGLTENQEIVTFIKQE